MTTRRSLLAAPVLLLSARAEAATQPGRQPPRLATPRQVRLRPGAAPVRLQARITERGQSLAVRFEGAGAPPEVFDFTSWYGYARVFAVKTLRGRDLVFAAFEGSTGTGTYQELQAVIGQDDDGIARILALETLHYRLTGPCGGGSWLAVAAETGAEGMRLAQTWRRQEENCPPRRGGPRSQRLAWTTTLGWSGRGVMTAPAGQPDAPAPRRRVEEVRARTLAWLATEPRRRITNDDLDALGIYDVLSHG
ncbi:hypothetical protein [Neoroseomonas oryzicola]|uniref:Uncharacterized protein n=1 Tax=Neoroseomonas oryzicola TaxID=535904 RepID=A0A9X9WEI9_9PROT|nr:hypothetical protein [Neoroseomonas oryzicola]MBR0658749.1 hypothetical protein [Neoroseomonas oryzicola]NKE17227.1 hypothetical protein [Neoroseomonas oryzicola]